MLFVQLGQHSLWVVRGGWCGLSADRELVAVVVSAGAGDVLDVAVDTRGAGALVVLVGLADVGMCKGHIGRGGGRAWAGSDRSSLARG